MAPPLHAEICTDGSAWPNPGAIGVGYVIVTDDGVRHEGHATAVHHGCGNAAEAYAAATALDAARALGVTHAVLWSDSQVLVGELTGTRRSRLPHLVPWFEAARARLAGFDEVSVRWRPRHKNAEADALARAALGLPVKGASTPRAVG